MRRWIKDEAKVLFTLGAVGFLTAYGAHAVVVNLPAYGRVYGLDYQAIGLLLAAYNLAEIIVKPLAGRLADRFGFRIVMLWGTAFFSLSCLAYLWLPPSSLPVLRVCQGIGAGALSVSSMAMVAALAEDRLGSSFGIYNAVKGSGYVLAPAVGGSFHGAAGMRGPLLMAGMAGLAVLAMQIAIAPHMPARILPRGTGMRKKARLWPWYLANFTDTALLGIMLGFLPVRADALGGGTREISILLICATFTYLVCQPAAGAWADISDRRVITLAGLATGCLGVVSLGCLGGIWLYAGAVVTGLGLGASWTNSLAMVGEAAGAGRMGKDLGLAGSFKDLGDMAGPLALGWLAVRHGLDGAFVLTGLAGLVLAAVAAVNSGKGRGRIPRIG